MLALPQASKPHFSLPCRSRVAGGWIEAWEQGFALLETFRQSGLRASGAPLTGLFLSIYCN